jgi:hypothetical protein
LAPSGESFVLSSLGWIAVFQVGAFVLLVALCARVALARSFESRRKRVLQLAAYIIAAHLGIGITQKDAWPITNYRLMHGRATLAGELSRFTFYGIDPDGREWRIDPYAWRSISDWHLHFWFWINFTRNLSAAQQQQALAWLFGLAEQQRSRLAMGDTSISPLGRLSAPEWWLFERQINVSPQPYRAFRVYLETFTIGGAIAEAEQPYRVMKGNLDRKLISEWKPR